MTCPRCGEEWVGEFYGVCPACVSSLRLQAASDGERIKKRAAEIELERLAALTP